MSQVYIIAEIGVNHNGDIELAHKLIDAAVVAGVDAVKFQTFNPELLVSKNAEKAQYQKNVMDDNQTQFQMLSDLVLSHDEFKNLQNYCKTKSIDFLSTPFDLESAAFLIHDLKLDTIKIGSGEITNAPLLYYIAMQEVKIILSTGMSTLGDIEQALGVIAYGYLQRAAPSEDAFRNAYFSENGRQLLNEKVTLLHCTSNYPAESDEINLNAIKTLQNAFPVSVGYSDHSMGIGISLGAVALGATVIEKHFTLDKNLKGPDHQASLLPNELKQLVSEIRELSKALGCSYKLPSEKEMNTASVARKSLVAAEEIGAGAIFSDRNLATKRPGNGVSPMKYWDYIGKRSQKSYEVEAVIDE